PPALCHCHRSELAWLVAWALVAEWHIVLLLLPVYAVCRNGCLQSFVHSICSHIRFERGRFLPEPARHGRFSFTSAYVGALSPTASHRFYARHGCRAHHPVVGGTYHPLHACWSLS